MPSCFVCESLRVFLKTLVTGYLVKGYYFYVSGHIPDRVPEEDLPSIDQKMIRKFRCDYSRATRVRRKKAGLANCHYLRFRRDFILVCTQGLGSVGGELHPFFAEHQEQVLEPGRGGRLRQFRDFRKEPLQFHGYSIGLRWEGCRPKGRNGRKLEPDRTTKRRGSVRIHREEFKALKAFMVDKANRYSCSKMEELFRSLPYEPYAPVRQQLLGLLRAVNRVRKARGWEPVPLKMVLFKAMGAGSTHLVSASKGREKSFL